MTTKHNMCSICGKLISAWDVQTQEATCFLIDNEYFYIDRDCMRKLVWDHLTNMRDDRNRQKMEDERRKGGESI